MLMLTIRCVQRQLKTLSKFDMDNQCNMLLNNSSAHLFFKLWEKFSYSWFEQINISTNISSKGMLEVLSIMWHIVFSEHFWTDAPEVWELYFWETSYFRHSDNCGSYLKLQSLIGKGVDGNTLKKTALSPI